MEGDASFGRWLQRWRKALDLTQDEFGAEVICSAAMIREIEADRRRPSRDLARRIAERLPLPPATREVVVQIARGERSPERLPPIPATPLEVAAPADNLPLPPTALIGREKEVTAATKHLRGSGRLLTFTGGGGVGKTHLALVVAAKLRTDFAGGVWFVDLAPIRDPEAVAGRIAQALDIREEGGRSVLAGLTADLRRRQALLVLDNFEQVVEAAPLVAGLLAAAPRLKVLATSREGLRLRGEREYPIPPLAIPDPSRLPALATLGEVASVALFVERAQAANPSFALDGANAAAVAGVCARLEGLPLAIELAAVRARHAAPADLLTQLERRLPVLTGGPRDLPERQQTLRATIAWSYDLLPPPQRHLFARLGVFAGGCTPAAARAAAGETGAGDIGDDLAALVDRHLLRREDRRLPDGKVEPRFAMLATVGEYAWERLVALGEETSARRCHADYYLALAEEGDRELPGTHGATWIARLQAEHDNLRAALDWALNARQSELGLRLGGALWRFWQVRGYFGEGGAWLRRLLEAGEEAPAGLRARALCGAGALAWRQGDPQAQQLFDSGLGLYRTTGDRAGMALALKHLGLIALYRETPDYPRAKALLHEGLALRRAVGDRDGVASCLNDLAIVALREADYGRARALLEESLALCRELGHAYGLTFVLDNLGLAALLQDDYSSARSALTESLVLSRDLGNREGIACAFARLAAVAAGQADAERAAQLFGAAEAVRDEIGHTLSPVDQALCARHEATARERLGSPGWEVARAAGKALPLDIAIAAALAPPGLTSPPARR